MILEAFTTKQNKKERKSPLIGYDEVKNLLTSQDDDDLIVGITVLGSECFDENIKILIEY